MSDHDIPVPDDDRTRAAFDALAAETAAVDTDAAYRSVEARRSPALWGTVPKLAGALAALVLIVVGVVVLFDDDPQDAVTADGQGDPTADTDLPTGDPESLAGSSWTLTSGRGPDGDITLVDGWPITLTFEADTLGGTAACNDYGSGYTLDGGRLTLDGIGMNSMGCAPDVQAAEATFLAALTDVTDARVDSDRLTLTGPSTELVFERNAAPPVDALVGPTWLLTALIQQDEIIDAMGDPATLVLRPDGTIEGGTGCRSLTGTYIVSGNQVFFNTLAADGECGPDLTFQDNVVLTVLGDGFVPTIADDVLTLTSAGNEGLTYRLLGEGDDLDAAGDQSASDALDGPWRLVTGDSPDGAIDPARTAAGEITLTFDIDALSISGSDGCNRYGADIVLGADAPRLGIGPIEAEQEGCEPPVDIQYQDALATVNDYGFEAGGDQLVLTGDAVELIFERPEPVDAPAAEPLTVTELLDTQPTTYVALRARPFEAEGGVIMCDPDAEATAFGCTGRWVTLVGADEASWAGSLGETIEVTGALEENGRFVVVPGVRPGDPAPETYGDLTLSADEADIVDAFRVGDIAGMPFADAGVALALGGEILATPLPAALESPGTWQLDLDGFRARVGPFSALELVTAADALTTFIGAHDHCASPPKARPDVEYDRQLVIQPTGVDSCLDWFSVDLFLDGDGVIVAVNLDLWEP